RPWATRLVHRWLKRRGVIGVRDAAVREILLQFVRRQDIGVQVSADACVRRRGDVLCLETD
ncbi:MAG: hypothetical protein HC809_03775, partial [Gammaproteobacteria bacterium]|nr:hypothetical protein [Gammaproteobacteria bacterium]